MGWAAPNTINQVLRLSTADEGQLYDLPYMLTDLAGSAGNNITTSTTPKIVLSSDKIYAQWDTSSSVAAYLKVQIPRQAAYQPSKKAATLNIPFLRLRVALSLLVPTTVGPDTPSITVTAVSRASNGAVKGPFTAVFVPPADGSAPTTAAVSNQTNPLLYVFDFFEVIGSGTTYLAPGDDMDIKIVPGAHTNDVLQLHGLRVECALNQCKTDPTIR
jgi:hypothetical protein